jgi:hypothetical protein
MTTHTRTLAVLTAGVLTLGLTACGGDDESTDSHPRDIQAENDRYESSLVPRMERTGYSIELDTAQEICDYVAEGKNEAEILEALDPQDDEWAAKAVRYTAHLMCDSDNSRNFEMPDAAEETIVPFEQRSPEEQQRGLEELAQLLNKDSEGTFSDGTHLVGSDIQPGTYRNEGTSACYWARLSGTGGTVDDIIANDNPRGQSYVTIDPSDTAFQSQNCGSWELTE